jgi:eukaryotic-like serine/threonine-protein kinase
VTDFTGQSIDRYHILASLGEGGMATVYKAYDTRLERDVAVKIIRTDQFGAAVLERILKRFEREAKALARLTHPNIVSVIDYGEYRGAPYLVMEYLPGGTLKQRLGHPMPWQEAVHILLPIAEALDYAHSQNIIHRDVKPSNILLTGRGQPMLSDFGIAKILESEETQTLTGTGIGVGTPEYMAPEQWTGQAVPQSDIYSLGVVFYELVTGRKPYTADTPAAILLKQANDPLPRPKKFASDLPDGVEKIIIKALAKKPENRYSGMEEFIAALETLLSGQTKTKQSVLPWGKPKAEKIHQPEQATPQVQKQIEDQPMGDARLSVKGKPREPASPEMPPGVASRQGRGKIRPVWIITLFGLSAVVAFAIWGLPPLAARLASTPVPTAITTHILSSIRTATFTYMSTPTRTTTLTKPSTPTLTNTPELGLTPAIGSTWTSPVDKMVMVYVPEGDFSMGSVSDRLDEQPVHKVYLDAYWIDKTEVTNNMYALCVAQGACQSTAYSPLKTETDRCISGDSPNSPVTCVDWDMANTYCQWAGRRLPSEAEWEKAARGTDGRTYPWGNAAPTCALANLYSLGNNTQPCHWNPVGVGNYLGGASPYGALDIAGNAWEWVNDWYSATYYLHSPERNPTGPDSGTYHVLRGLSWENNVDVVRSAYRLGGNLTDIYNYNPITGFRCARSAQ